MAGASGDQEEVRGNMVTSSGIDEYCYSENFHQEMYNNMTTNMEMIGFGTPLSKNHHQLHNQNSSSSSSAAVLWNKQNNYQQNNFMLSSPDQFANSSSCVFPCEGNERPSQEGLSLSLNSSNPSTIGLHSFELRSSLQVHDDLRFGPPSSRSVTIQPQQPQGYNSNNLQIRHLRYIGPAQELLDEFCNLGVKQNDHKLKAHKSSSELQDDEMKIQNYPLDPVELQSRKTKLLHMLAEVDRRYNHYCDQMKAVVSSFEEVAGNGTAKMYSALASKAMSRHFRCLRDGIVTQIKDTKKAMGEKDTTNGAPGTTKGETPRLKLLDRTLRQQRALQQMTMMETHPWKPQRGLPERSVSVLRAWLFEHFLHPYPSDVDKHVLARQTGLSRSQVSNWFINARVRLWKPMVEEMYMEELKDHGVADPNNNNELENQFFSRNEDQKPTHDQLLNIDSECLSSVVNNPGKHDELNKYKQHGFGRDSYGEMELDFSSYNQSAGGAASSYGGGDGAGVSLTLGLHQHGASGGVSLAFTPASQSALFYPRGDQMEDCQTVPYSPLDSESQNMAYRNLMGAQLLHDLAG